LSCRVVSLRSLLDRYELPYSIVSIEYFVVSCECERVVNRVCVPGLLKNNTVPSATLNTRYIRESLEKTRFSMSYNSNNTIDGD